jgi:hypothetical protein
MSDSQSASLSLNKAPIWGLQPDLYYCHTVAGLLTWGSLSDERTGLSFTIAADIRRRSHSRVRVQWDLQSYFTVSDSRLPFLSPPITCRALNQTQSQSQSQSQSYFTTDTLLPISSPWRRAS